MAKERGIDKVYEALYQTRKDGRLPVSIVLNFAFEMQLRKEFNPQKGHAWMHISRDSQTVLGLPYVVIHDMPEDFKIGT